MIAKFELRDIVERALREDAPWGDLTCETIIPEDATANALLVAREPGIVAGGAVVPTVFSVLGSVSLPSNVAGTASASSSAVQVSGLVADGQRFEAGEVLARLSGNARQILTGERVALNLLQRLSGIATLTGRYVDAVRSVGSSSRIVDTRKTTPGLRNLEKHAVTCGGGYNHRSSLSDAVMVKDNHLAVLAEQLGFAAGPDAITASLRELRARLGHTVHIEVEVDRLDQIEPVLAAEPDTIMLDNFSLEDLAAGVRQVAGRALTEASGGVNLDTVAAIASTGVDLISVGALTHGVKSLDLGLDITIETNPVDAK